MPVGGIGALLFGAGLYVFLGAIAYYYYNQSGYHQAQEIVLKDQEQLLFREYQKLHSQVDTLQNDLTEKGNVLLNREQILQQTTESLKHVQMEKQIQASTPVPDPKKPRHDLFIRLTEALKPQPSLSECTLIDGGEGVILRVNNGLLFDPAELTVNAKGVEILKQIALILKEVPMAPVVELQSHTDDQPPGASLVTTYPTNWEVSARRASSILRTLSNEGGMSAKNLKAVGMGDSHPIAPNDTKENKAMNRRLDILIKPVG